MQAIETAALTVPLMFVIFGCIKSDCRAAIVRISSRRTRMGERLEPCVPERTEVSATHTEMRRDEYQSRICRSWFKSRQRVVDVCRYDWSRK